MTRSIAQLSDLADTSEEETLHTSSEESEAQTSTEGDVDDDELNSDGTEDVEDEDDGLGLPYEEVRMFTGTP